MINFNELEEELLYIYAQIKQNDREKRLEINKNCMRRLRKLKRDIESSETLTCLGTTNFGSHRNKDFKREMEIVRKEKEETANLKSTLVSENC